MSSKYPGGFITKSPVAPTASAASGIWTVDQAMQYQLAGTWPAPPSTIVDNYFSSFALTGNGSSNNMYTGSSGPAVSLSTIGGLTWVKNRSSATEHVLTDTIRGVNSQLSSSSTAAATTNTNCVTGFYTNQFTTGANSLVNGSGNSIIGWTFGRRIKFFDVVTYTGDGNASQTISHNLASVPGCMIVKSISAVTNWQVYHQNLPTPAGQALQLNLTSAVVNNTTFWNSTSPTSSNFTVGSASNTNGVTFVAYLFAHNAGSFGSSGTENAITCGTFTTNSGGNTVSDVNLGYEPQWLLVKSTGTGDWQLFDTMRGMPVDNGSGSGAKLLYPNLTNSEASTAGWNPTATGFRLTGGAAGGAVTFVYIAIRKAMYTPSDYYRNYAVTNFVSESTTPTAYPNQFVPGFWPDMVIEKYAGGTAANRWVTRLQGNSVQLDSSTTNAETAVTSDFTSRTQYVIVQATFGSAGTAYGYVFKRGAGMLDIVCYTGNGTTQNVLHNLTVIPELIIVKGRSGTGSWATLVTNSSVYGYLNSSGSLFAASTGINQFGNGTVYVPPTSTQFTVGADTDMNASGSTYVAYLWASLAGCSKVGTYTGTGTLQTIDCGFNSFSKVILLIKRTDAAGNWYVFDNVQGMGSGNDAYWLMNSSAAQVTGTNYVDTTAAGFQVTAAASTTVNVSGATYIYLVVV